MLKEILRGHRPPHDFRCYLRVASLSLTPVICRVLVHCFGSFLLQDLFLSLQVFAFNKG